MSFLMHANRVKVSPQLLGEAMKVHAVLAPEDRKSFEARTISIIQMLERKG